MATRPLCRALVLLAASSSALPLTVRAAPAPATVAAADLAAFDRGFRAGQEEFDRKQYLVAARTWTRTAAQLPETEEHRDNRRAIHEYIAEAYEKAVAAETADPDAVVREGLGVLDSYSEAFTAAYPQETLPEPVTRVQQAFRARVAAAAPASEPEAAKPQPLPPPAATEPARPPSKPWKGLAIGGGVAIGGGAAMLALFAVGAARGRSSEAAFDDPANMCSLADPTGECADINAQGRRANAMSVAGIITAPLLLGAGAAMLVIAARRKKPSNTALAPALGRGLLGVVWQQRF